MSFVSGPIVAVMGTAEGVIVKARELIGAALGRTGGVDEKPGEDEAEAGADPRNAQVPTEG